MSDPMFAGSTALVEVRIDSNAPASASWPQVFAWYRYDMELRNSKWIVVRATLVAQS
jgi:hypothetical protein